MKDFTEATFTEDSTEAFMEVNLFHGSFRGKVYFHGIFRGSYFRGSYFRESFHIFHGRFHGIFQESFNGIFHGSGETFHGSFMSFNPKCK